MNRTMNLIHFLGFNFSQFNNWYHFSKYFSFNILHSGGISSWQWNVLTLLYRKNEMIIYYTSLSIWIANGRGKILVNIRVSFMESDLFWCVSINAGLFSPPRLASVLVVLLNDWSRGGNNYAMGEACVEGCVGSSVTLWFLWECAHSIKNWYFNQLIHYSWKNYVYFYYYVLFIENIITQ